MRHSWRRTVGAAVGLGLVAGAVAGSGSTAATAPPADEPSADRFVYGWYLGVPIRPMAITPPAYGGVGPEAPADDVPDLTVYLVGPVDDESPVGPSVEIPTADGGTGVLPPHQQTHDLLVPEDDPHDAIGTFVVAGPQATADTVRTREAPAGSVAGAPLAYAVRIGQVWAPLSNHLAIELGLQRGLLEVVPFEYGGLMWTTFLDDRAFTDACVSAPAPVAPDSTAPPVGSGPAGPAPAEMAPERVVYGYYLGLPMRPMAILPPQYGGTGPAGPSEEVPDLAVYLAAPFDAEAPSAPAREGIPTPDGPRNLPTHTQIHDRLVSPDEPHDAMGVFLVAGPEATADNVRLGDEVDNSVAGAPLVSHVKLGDVWLGLSNHLVIEHALALGLLDAVPFEFGGLMWQTFDDPDFWIECADG